MRMRIRLGAAAVAICALLVGCSDDSSSEAKPPSTSTTAKAGAVSTTAASLPAGIAKSEQLCSLTRALADKLQGAEKPQTPEELAPYIRDLNTFLQQAAPVAPQELVADIQNLSQFYGRLGDQVSSAPQESNPFRLADLAASSNRLRQYFKTICGVDDQVFNL